ncbi:MAG: phosphodiesterase [Treponemataceae bacterium]|nr:phosphodiesterase [Treponemataceae bacterium]
MRIFIISDIHGSLSAFDKAMEAYSREKAGLLVICGDYLNHGPRNDIPDGYDTKGLAAALNKVKSFVLGVRGNCDSEVDQMMLEFPVLAPYTTILLPRDEAAGKGASCGGLQTEGAVCRRIFVHHGHLYTAEEAAKLNPAGAVIVSGHTHVPVLERFVLKTEASSDEAGLQSGESGASGGGCTPAEAACRGGNCLPSADGTCIPASYVLLNPGSVSIPKGGSEPGYAVIETCPDAMTIRLCSLAGKTLKVLECQ